MGNQVFKASAEQAPDASLYNESVGYMRQLYESTGLSQRECSQRLGVSFSTFKTWLAGTASWPYTAQYTLERLAAFSANQKGNPQ